MYRVCFLLCSLFLLLTCSKAPVESDRWQRRSPDAPSKTTHRILIEKYTGQECVNCPTAATLLEGLQATYPDRLIVVSMHAAYTGQTLPALRSGEADAYARYFHIQRAVPGIMLDRCPLSDGKIYSTSSAQWAGEILTALQRPASLDLSLQVQSEKVGTAWSCRVKLSSSDQRTVSSGNYLLTLWLVEDVIAPQKTASGTNSIFLHRNVLRHELAKTSITLDAPFTQTFAIPNDLVDKTKAKIIAFVSDPKDGRILEARLQSVPEAIPTLPDKPQDPSTDQPKKGASTPTFIDAATGKPIPSDQLITCRPEHPLVLVDGVAEITSPYVRLLLPEGEQAPLDVELQVTSQGAGAETHGLSGVCLESCQTLEKLASSYTLRGYKSRSTDLIGIHYGLSKSWARRTGIYEVKLYLKQEGKIVTSLTYRFVVMEKDYAKQPEPPTPKPTPTPPVPEEPKPTPTPPAPEEPKPGPLPPGGVDDIPEAHKTHVVVFDFTGQYCGYCADALQSIERTKKKLGEYFLPVAVQASGRYNNGAELRCEDAYMFEYFYGRTGYPNLFMGTNKEKVYPSNLEWPISNAIAQKPQVKIRFTATNTDQTVTVHFKALPNNGMTPTSQVRVLFLLIQSNIIAYQVHLSSNYSHQHVLRRGLNDWFDGRKTYQWIWGDPYTFGEDFTKTFKFSDARFHDHRPEVEPQDSRPIVPKDCEVIAILLDEKTKTFLNAASVSLK